MARSITDTMPRREVLLTIGGSDPSAGAGIQADLKTFQVLGVYGVSVITSVTSQNTSSFISRFDLPVEVIRSQIRAIIDDMQVALVKVGMVGGSDVIKVIAEELSGLNTPLILDPVIRSSTDGALLDELALEDLKKELVAHSYLVTPNIFEAEKLTNLRIRNIEAAKKAAVAIKKIGAETVIVTGGHLDGIDLLLDRDGEFSSIGEGMELVGGDFHGTGCTYTAALAVNLFHGEDLLDAAIFAKRFVTDAIKNAYPVGSGFLPINQSKRLINAAERYIVLEDLKGAVAELLKLDIATFLPEVGSNLAVAIPDAEGIDDVAAVRGRIVRCGDAAIQVGPIEFGASDHIARIVLALMRFDPDMRACFNMRYSEQIINACSDIGLESAAFEREDEPEGVKTMDWGVESVIKELRTIPDVIYDKGGIGKEAMVRITGRKGLEVTSKVKKIIEVLGY